MRKGIVAFVCVVSTSVSVAQHSSLGDAVFATKSYKEAMALTTLNVNKIIAGYEDGLELWHNRAYPAKRKVTVTKINTGRTDVEGNPVYFVKLTDIGSQDSVILYPKYEFFPVEYMAVSYIHSKEKYPISGNYSTYHLHDVQRKTFYTNATDSYSQTTADISTSSYLVEKIGYDRQDLLKDAVEKRYLGYTKMIEDHYTGLQGKTYNQEIAAAFKNDYTYFGSAFASRIKLKVKKTVDAAGTITELTFIVPFTDGSFPEKEEFYIHATRAQNGFFEITSRRTLEVNMGSGGTRRIDVLPGFLLPFDGSVLIVQQPGGSVKGKGLAASVTNDVFAPHPYQLQRNRWYDEYSKSEEFKEMWKLKNTTQTYDFGTTQAFDNYIGIKLVAYFKEHL